MGNNNNSGFNASGALAFVRSPGQARGQYAAGVKTIRAVLPYLGYGNVVAKSTTTDIAGEYHGTISTDPNIPWLYTKKEISVSWSHHVGDFYNGRLAVDMYNDWIAYLQSLGWVYYSDSPFGGSGAGVDGPRWQMPTGETYGVYPALDFSDPSYSVFPTTPTVLTNTSATDYVQQIFPYYDVSGSTLTQHVVTTGSSDESCDGVDYENTFNEFGASPATDPGSSTTNSGALNYVAPSATGLSGEYPVGTTIPNGFAGYTDKFEHDLNVSGGTITETWSGQRLIVVAGTGISPFVNKTYGQETFSMTVTTIYSVPVAISDLEATALALLGQTHLTNTAERYYFFDSAPNIQLNWNPITWDTTVWLANSWGLRVYRAPVVSGVVGSYSNVANFFASGVIPTQWIDTGAVLGNTYSYYILVYAYTLASVYTQVLSSAIQVTATPGTPNIYQYAAPTPSGTTAFPAAPTGFAVAVAGSPLLYSDISNPLIAQQQIALFPTSAGGGSFVISVNVPALTPLPFILAERAEPLAGGVIPSGTNFAWSKSRGYLVGNSPNHSPPVTTTYKQKFYYVPASYVGSGSVDETAAFPQLTFPHGRKGQYAWQLTKELPSQKEAFMPSDVPAFGYIKYL